MLATSQLGITICSLLILNVSEPAIHHLLEGRWGSRAGRGRRRRDRVRHRARARVVPARRLRRDGAEEPGVLGARSRGAPARAAAGVRGARCSARSSSRSTGLANGVLRLFGVEPKDEAASTFTARGGADHRRPVATRGRARRREPAPDGRVRVHRQAGEGCRGAAVGPREPAADGDTPGRDRARGRASTASRAT